LIKISRFTKQSRISILSFCREIKGNYLAITLSLTLPPQEGGNYKVTTVAKPQEVTIY
jgi:hypothetical protein